MSTIRIPPLPRILVMEDRATGQLWVLTHDRGPVATAQGHDARLGFPPKERIMVSDQVPTNLEFATGILNGTTGTDGKATLGAATNGNLYLENRLGSARAFTPTFLSLRSV